MASNKITERDFASRNLIKLKSLRNAGNIYKKRDTEKIISRKDNLERSFFPWLLCDRFYSSTVYIIDNISTNTI